jgi:hypothetical protein
LFEVLQKFKGSMQTVPEAKFHSFYYLL